jgi:hypothetical protein
VSRRTDRSDDRHDRFSAWLQAGAAGDPPRDAAVHAAHCVRCRAAMAALDDLLLIDAGQAPLPPSRAAVRGRVVPVAVPPRLAAAAAAVFVVVGATAWIGIGALAPGLIGGNAPASVDQDVLGGAGAGASATLSPSLGGVTSEPERPTPTVTRRASASQAVAAPTPTTAQPAAPTPTPPRSSPDPTRRPTPTQEATPSPTPASLPPTPSPTPFGACDDGIDNDGDTLIDAFDPGCAVDGNEFAG